MDDWEPTPLGNICKTNQHTYSISDKWKFINYLDTGNITENRVNEIQRIVIGKDTLPSRARRKVAVDDIIYSTVRPNQRHYGIVKDMHPNMLVSTGFTVITVDKEKADSYFIYYYLTQSDIVNHLHAIGEQSVSAYPSIKPSDIESLELLLPPLPEQVEIGRTLRVLDEKITNNAKINHHLASWKLASTPDNSPDRRRGKRISRRANRRLHSFTRRSRIFCIGIMKVVKSSRIASVGIATL